MEIFSDAKRDQGQLTKELLEHMEFTGLKPKSLKVDHLFLKRNPQYSYFFFLQVSLFQTSAETNK